MQTRYSHRVRTDCSVIFSGGNGVGEGRLVNLSLPGCLLESTEHISPTDYMRLRLFLPDQQAPLEVNLAAVRWVGGSRVGLEFIRTSKDAQRRLERFVLEQSDGRRPGVEPKDSTLSSSVIGTACDVRVITLPRGRASDHA
jgi:PilZ domain